MTMVMIEVRDYNESINGYGMPHETHHGSSY